MPLAIPTDLEVTPSSFSTLRVSWGSAPGATQYMILYSALNHGEPDDAKEVRSGPLYYVCVPLGESDGAVPVLPLCTVLKKTQNIILL